MESDGVIYLALRINNDLVMETKEFSIEQFPILVLTLGQLALAWVVNQPGNIIALAGARNVHQAQENARAGAASFLMPRAWQQSRLPWKCI